MQHSERASLARRSVHGAVVVVGAAVLTAAFFLVLPLIQAITKQAAPDTTLQSLDSASLPPPPPAQEEEPEPEPEVQEKPPELVEDTQLLDLAQLELALNPTLGEGLLGGDFAMRLNTVTTNNEVVDALFSLSDLDQEPRGVHRPGPAMTADMRKRAPMTVHVLFTVDQRGRVETAVVQQANDPVFDKAALAAVKQWRFEPGKRNGQPVKFRMRVPITFPKKS